MTSSAMSRVTSRAMCRGTRTRGVGEVVDDKPVQGGVVDDELRDEPRDVPRHQDARRCRSSRRRACVRRSSRDERRNELRDEPRDVPRHSDARSS
jgi:hypothetical protein